MTDEEVRLHRLDLIQAELNRLKNQAKRLTDGIHLTEMALKALEEP